MRLASCWKQFPDLSVYLSWNYTGQLHGNWNQIKHPDNLISWFETVSSSWDRLISWFKLSSWSPYISFHLRRSPYISSAATTCTSPWTTAGRALLINLLLYIPNNSNNPLSYPNPIYRHANISCNELSLAPSQPYFACLFHYFGPW